MVEVFCRSGNDRRESLHDGSRTESPLKKRKSHLYSKKKCVWEKRKNPLISFPTPSILMLLFIPHRLVYRYNKFEKVSRILVLEWKGGKATMTSNAIVGNCTVSPPLTMEWGPRRKAIQSSTYWRFCTISFKLYFRFLCYISSTQKPLLFLSAFNSRAKGRNPKLLNYLLLKNLALTGVPGWLSAWVTQLVKCLDSWFCLRLWSWGCKIKPHMGLHFQHKVCFRFSFPLPLPLCSLSFSKINKLIPKNWLSCHWAPALIV